jgi:glycosyltransferase involved in cell wall biosynthesis
MRRQSLGDGTRILIIVQNLPVPFDRRVWLECQALVAAGRQVAVICPKADGDPGYEKIDSVHLYKYSAPSAGRGLASFAWEFAYSFVVTLLLSVRVFARHRFDVIQACNPPDTFWALALLYRPFGVRFVYDQHDLCPELYRSRFAGGSATVHRVLVALEAATYRVADEVIVTNASYKATALTRGRVPESRVTIVRTGPDPSVLKRVPPRPEHRRGREHLVVYLGVMGPQDGVDLVVQAAALLVGPMGRDDIAFTLIGAGDCFGELRRLTAELDLEDFVQFTGRAPDPLVAEILSSADIGLCPDPKNPLNDVSTMNKTMEYMAFGLPVVAFDLTETRVSAGDAAVYAEPNDVAAFAQAIVGLIDDPATRQLMASTGRRRVEDVLAWSHQRPRYVGVYDRFVAQPSALSVRQG